MRTYARDSRGFWRLWDRARSQGAEIKPGTAALQWSLSGGHRHPCIRPRYVGRIVGVRKGPIVQVESVPETHFTFSTHTVVVPSSGRRARVAQRDRVGYKNTTGWIDLWGRCRVCEACEAQQRTLWIARATAETRQCRGRTWFVTLTCRPADRDWLEAKAIREANERAVNWHELPPEQRRHRLFRAFYGEVSQYLKRVREELRVKGRRRLRFFAVCEAHKDGFPHAHLLVHEEAFADANERTLRKKWRLGHAKAILVNNPAHAAVYVTKYLTKSTLVVRASQKYGRSQPQALLEQSESVGRAQRRAPDPPTHTHTPTHKPPRDRGGFGGVDTS